MECVFHILHSSIVHLAMRSILALLPKYCNGNWPVPGIFGGNFGRAEPKSKSTGEIRSTMEFCTGTVIKGPVMQLNFRPSPTVFRDWPWLWFFRFLFSFPLVLSRTRKWKYWIISYFGKIKNNFRIYYFFFQFPFFFPIFLIIYYRPLSPLKCRPPILIIVAPFPFSLPFNSRSFSTFHLSVT